jgi:hypothetical protein
MIEKAERAERAEMVWAPAMRGAIRKRLASYREKLYAVIVTDLICTMSTFPIVFVIKILSKH